jgi:hypothetical protein
LGSRNYLAQFIGLVFGLQISARRELRSLLGHLHITARTGFQGNRRG